MVYFSLEIPRKSGVFHQAIKITRNQYARVGERNGETNNKKEATCNRHGIVSALKAMKLTSCLLPAEEMNRHLTMQLHRTLIFYQGQIRGNVKMWL